MIDAVIALLCAAGAVAIALAQVSDPEGRTLYLPGQPDRGGVLVVGSALTALGAVSGAVRAHRNAATARRFRDLEDELGGARKALQELSRLELADLFEFLKYTTSERISLFIPSEDHAYLRLVARYALAQEYMAHKRDRYPLNQGCLGRAYKSGESMVAGLPDPQLHLAEWSRRLREEADIPEAVSKAFRMKSRTCIALGIRPPLKPYEGVVVFESQRLTEGSTGAQLDVDERLRKSVKQRYGARLNRLVEIWQNLPDA